MQYIIIDLEWNTAYSKKMHKYINEIIEIGAVKLDDNLNLISEFSSFVHPQIQKKLRKRVTQLTNITNDDIKDGKTFCEVIDEFSEWIGDEESIVMSWGNMDIRVMYDNMKYFKDESNIPFIKYYVDLQEYCMEVLELPKSQQISLNNASEILNINLEDFVLHRALVDSQISAECFKKVKDDLRLKEHIKKCNKEFYDRLFFKPYIVTKLDSKFVDKSIMNCKCTECGKSATQLEDWHFINGYFRTFYYCKNCDIKMRVNIQFKKYFDSVNVKKNVTKVEKKKHKDEKKADA